MYTGLQVGAPRELVGLGWGLQAGGSITRQVNGLVDEDFAQDPTRRYSADKLLNQLANYSYLKLAYENEVDTGPDVYSFSLPTGLSGRFILQDTLAVLLPQQPVHVRWLDQRGFQITTEDGVRYQFLAIETTEPHASTFGKVTLHRSAWHLSQLISADNTDTIRLCYTPHRGQLHRQSTLTTGSYYTGKYTEVGNVGNGDGNCGSAADYAFTNVKMGVSFVTAQYLDSITTRGSRLLLVRADSTANYELRRLRLLATIDGRREVKRFTLYQSPFKGGTATDYRLRLDSLQESGPTLSLPAYRFTYNTAAAIPARISAAKDYWGYANGALENGDFSTNIRPALLTDPLLVAAGIKPANREPNYDFTKVGALELVRYPTGGSTRWDYEQGLLAASDLQDIPLVTKQLDSFFCVYDENNLHTVTLINSPPISPPATKQVAVTTKIFTVPEQDNVELLVSRDTDLGHETNGDINNRYREFNLWCKLPARGQQPARDSLITNMPDGTSSYKVTEPTTSKTFVFRLSPGTYVAKLYCEPHETLSELAITIHYHDSTQVKLGLPGPGIRVARTTTTAPGSPPLVRTYSYVLGRSSSGRSLLPKYGKGFEAYPYSFVISGGGQGAYTGADCQRVATASDDRGLGNEFNKYDFYYAAVTEAALPTQGKTSHAFTHLAQQFNDVVPTAEVVYRQNSLQPQTWQMAQSTYYTYFSDSLRAYTLPRMRLVVDRSNDVSGNNVTDQYAYQLYDVHAAFVVPVLTTQTQFDAQGDTLSTRTYSTYQRQRLVRTATQTNTGWQIQRYKRLSDYTSQPAVLALRGNSFNPVVETQTWQRPLLGNDSVLVGGRLTFYHPTWHSPSRTYRLRLDRPVAGLNQESRTNGRYDQLLSDTRYEPETSLRYAATTGDLLEQRPAHGVPTSYLLGYARTLVIAQAQHASYAQLAYTSFEAAATGRWRYDSTATSPHRQASGHTGHYAYQLSGADKISRDQVPAGDYLLSYWLQGPEVPTLTLLGGTLSSPAQELVAGPAGWHQLQVRVHFSGPGTVRLAAPTSGQPAVLDDLLLQPVGAQVSTYTHDPLVGVTSQTGPDGRTLFYDYDGLGRLVRTRDEQGRILSQQQYHYAGK